MKTTSRYFVFFIISLALYVSIFLYFDQTTLIKPLPLNSGEQTIQVNFVAQPLASKKPITPEPELKTKIGPEIEIEQETAAVSTTQPAPKKIISIASDNSGLSDSEVKLRKQVLQGNIANTTAESAATLKATLFDQQLRAEKMATKETQLVPNVKKEKKVKKVKKVRRLSPPKKAISRDITAPLTNKSVIKKRLQAAPLSATPRAENQGVLQQAIVVSGHKPVYPQRAILRNQQGRVVVKITVTNKGEPENPSILSSSGYSILDDAVLAFIKQELFMPALQGQTTVTSEQLFSFRFELS